jgi:hypothetical protein
MDTRLCVSATLGTVIGLDSVEGFESGERLICPPDPEFKPVGEG